MRVVTLGKVRYAVRVVRDAQKHRARSGLEDVGEVHGYLHPHKKQIVLEQQESKTMSSTLLHEIVHVLLPYLDEDAVRAVEENLFPTLWAQGWRPF